MTNPAVAKWLEEIAQAKAKAQAKAATTASLTPGVTALSISATADSSSSTTSSTSSSVTAATKSYGIISSFSLKTRKKQLRLVLPPPPIKPGPGECCGNDCDPCVNTLYQQDLAEHQEIVRKLKIEFEQACLDLERGLDSDSITVPQDDSASLPREIGSEDESGLSIRSYRPFNILRKEYLAENTLLIVCDAPHTINHTKNRAGKPREADPIGCMFHVLIRFKVPEKEEYFTKAFTPVDLSSFHDSKVSNGDQNKLTFLIKLYPTPHQTSDMFRGLHVGTVLDVNKGDDRGVLYLRGPIQTSRATVKDQVSRPSAIDSAADIDGNVAASAVSSVKDRDGVFSKSKNDNRIVMIAAGSGITPMYQLLRAIRDHEDDYVQALSSQEIDLIYCNRTKHDIWLRQELRQLKASTAFSKSTRTVRVRHVLSSTSKAPQELPDPTTSNDYEEERMHSGRITLSLLRETLEHNMSAQGTVVDRETDIPPLQILICGPPSFNKDVSEMLTQLGYSSLSLSPPKRCDIHILE
ncbi:NADH-cytochrome b5 reductase-like [Gryganskiella cystojenkinii]|nr:NADH-cytochrome b5 reductase-like [Gryganskiella cystojenkinii]